MRDSQLADVITLETAAKFRLIAEAVRFLADLDVIEHPVLEKVVRVRRASWVDERRILVARVLLAKGAAFGVGFAIETGDGASWEADLNRFEKVLGLVVSDDAVVGSLENLRVGVGELA
jgi:hypothetical protein